VTCMGGSLLMSKGRPDRNHVAGRVDFDSRGFNFDDVFLLADQELLAEKAVGDIVLRWLLVVGQMEVQGNPEHRRHKAGGAESQNQRVCALIQGTRLRCDLS